ncbi:MAG: alpha/beta hydrolase family protein [Myxococcota bacterium]
MSLVRICGLVLALGCSKAGPQAAADEGAASDGASVSESDVVGEWSGTVSAGAAFIPVVLRIRKDEGVLASELDSPKQKLTGLPAGETRLEQGRLTITFPVIGGALSGVVSPGLIVGNWTQAGRAMPIRLTPGPANFGSASAATHRPQHPKPPFPYTQVPAKIPSADGVVLAGTFTVPNGEGPFPAVVLMSGSGPQDRDETMVGHKPFWVIADHLSRNGIAVLRYDDRGTASSTGSYSTATLQDFAEDGAAAMAWTRARSETSAVGYLGHSEGGYTAPLAQRTQPGDFLVFIAPPAVAGDAILIEQGRRITEAEGGDAAMIARQSSSTAAVMRLLKSGAPDDEIRGKLRAVLADNPDVPEPMVNTLTAQYLRPWFRGFVLHDPTADLQAIDVPTLAMWGSRDLQVPPTQSVKPMKAAMGKNLDVRVFDGLNHLMQPTETGAVSEYGQIETTFSVVVLDAMTQWIQARPAE